LPRQIVLARKGNHPPATRTCRVAFGFPRFGLPKLQLAKHTAVPYNMFMLFIEATAFTKHVYDYLSEKEYHGLQIFLLQSPEAGKIVRGSGGVRKVRWAMAGKGKSGGVRVIYYFKRQDNEIWLLTIYSKNEIENIPAHILRQIAKEIQNV
jgi:mRNA-degrading endonuclease RelE of RelBE toxin-antitoxin system